MADDLRELLGTETTDNLDDPWEGRMVGDRISSACGYLDPLPVDDGVADAWAELRIALRETGRKLAANDSWIAAAAIAHRLPIATQDSDYDDVPGLTMIKL